MRSAVAAVGYLSDQAGKVQWPPQELFNYSKCGFQPKCGKWDVCCSGLWGSLLSAFLCPPRASWQPLGTPTNHPGGASPAGCGKPPFGAFPKELITFYGTPKDLPKYRIPLCRYLGIFPVYHVAFRLFWIHLRSEMSYLSEFLPLHSG